MKKIKILNVELDSITQDELLKQLKKGVLVTPNVDQVMRAQSDREYHDIVKRAEWVVCDSRILFFFVKLLGTPVPEAIPGSSFFPAFYEYHKDDENCKIFLLGAKEGVAQIAMERINEKVGRPIVVGAYSPSFGFEENEDENKEIHKMINESGANVVLVGVGCPKQEKWIDAHKAMMPGVDIWMALGATIGFEAGTTKRAPMIWRKLCMEWFYRFLQEPVRMYKRYFIRDMRFFWYFGNQMLGKYKDPFKRTY